MQLKFQLSMVLLILSIAGCGQVSVFGRTIGEPKPAEAKSTPEVKTDSTSAAKTTAAPRAQKVRGVALALTPQAAANAAADSRFSADALLAAVKTELLARKLLDEVDPAAIGTAEISLDEYSMRPTSNAIVFGNIISDGKLNGDIRLRNAQGELQSHRIEVVTRISIPANRETANPLGSLYRQFAMTTGNILAGTPAKPIETNDQRPR